MTDVQAALDMIAGVRVFVTSRERIKKPEGDELFDESLATIRAHIATLTAERDGLREDAERLERQVALAVALADAVDAETAALEAMRGACGMGEVAIAESRVTKASAEFRTAIAKLVPVAAGEGA